MDDQDLDLVTRREAAGIWITNISALILVITLATLAVSVVGQVDFAAAVISAVGALVAAVILAAGLVLRFGD